MAKYNLIILPQLIELDAPTIQEAKDSIALKQFLINAELDSVNTEEDSLGFKIHGLLESN